MAKISRQWKANAQNSGASRDIATGVIQLHPDALPDYDENESDEDIRRKLALRFDIARGMTQDAIAGRAPGVIFSGPPGVGKSHDVLDELKADDPEMVRHKINKGYIKATGLYRLLWKRRFPGNVTVFDDADSIYTDETALQFIKIATDSVDERVLSYGAEFNMFDEEEGVNIPREFEFKGAVIFITNLNLDLQVQKGTKLAPHLEAMISRSHYIDLGMRTKRDYLIRIFDVVDQGLLSSIGLTREMEDDVLKFIEDHTQSLRELSLRMAIKIGHLRMNQKPTSKINWDDIARVTCCKGLG